MPTAEELAAFLGPRYSVDADQAEAVIAVVTAHANAYTRGQGFTDGVPNADVSSAILTASARLISHSRQVGVGEVYGPSSAQYAAAPFSWSVAELLVLDRYRVKAL